MFNFTPKLRVIVQGLVTLPRELFEFDYSSPPTVNSRTRSVG